MTTQPFLRCCALVLTLSALGCTDPKETTAVGAAAGGALGAGLGAIVGSQVGSGGGGLVIGAVAGAAGGALVGNSIQAQQESIQTQDEAIERQQRTIAAQRRELDELRKVRGDDNSGPRAARTNGFDGPRAVSNEPLARMRDANQRPGLGERDIALPPPSNSSHTLESDLSEPNFPKNKAQSRTHAASGTASLNKQDVDAEDCSKADVEMVSARKAAEASDKLFHIRRALRLCPSEADHHFELAKVYTKLGRNDDAAFEVKETLKLNPSHDGAKTMSRSMGSAGKKY